MRKLKKVVLLLLTVAVISLGLTGCKGDNEHPTGEHPTSEHPTSEHPSAADAPNVPAAPEHPTGEHPR